MFRNGFFADEDDENGTTAAHDALLGSPDDSHYELSPIYGDDANGDDSQVELPAFSMDSEAPEGERHTAIFDPARPDAARPAPWYYDYISSWGRYHVITALGFATISLFVLAGMLLSSLVGGPIIDISSIALIVGCVGTIAFLLLTLPLAALVALLADLGKSLRQLHFRSDGSLPSAAERTASSRRDLSRSIG
jgi:hypothetical protein